MRIALSVVSLVLLSFCLALGQSWSFYYSGMDRLSFVDFNSSGFGARSRGMGGVYMAINNEAYASFENPATMVFINKSLMSVELINSMDKHTGLSEPRPLNTLATRFDIDTIDYKNSHTKLIQAGAVAPFVYFGRDWWVGGGFHTVNDFNLTYKMPVDPNNPDNYDREKSLDALNLAIAAKPLDYLAIGVNLNYFIRRYEENFYAWDLVLYDTSTTNLFDYHYRDKSSFSGANFDIGIMAEYNVLTFGAVVRTPYTLTQNVFRLMAQVDNYGQDLGSLDRMTLKYKIPLSYGAGIAAKPIDNLTLAADIDVKPYSNAKKTLDLESINASFFPTYPEYVDINAEWNDLTQFRIGGEYVFKTGFAQIPLRAGLHNMPNLQFPSKITADSSAFDSSSYYHYQYEYTDKVNPLIISFGAGIKFEKIWFDAAYEFGSAKYNQTVEVPGALSNKQFEFNYSRIYLSASMLF